ncbi:hypothetical protein BJX76DRAFT_362635 [Aspergillus varians]
MSVPRKAIIIGGGPAGLSVALRLHQTTNIKCTIYEIRPEPTTLGGAIGIPANGLRLLDRLGVYQSLLNRGSSQSDFVLHSGSGSLLGQQDDAAAYSRAETGYGYMRIKRADVVDVLLKEVRKAGIPIHFGKKITEIKDGKNVSVVFEDGTKATADILFGCDGIHSTVRKIYVDPPQAPEYSGMSVLFSLIPATRLSAAAAARVRGLSATLTAEGMFLAAPCTNNRDELFWGFTREVAIPDAKDTRDGWEVQARQEIDDFKSNLHGVLSNTQADWLDTLHQLIDQTDVMKFFPIYRLPLGGTWSRGRCVLIGDAAHAMQPHTGQGASMALEDAFLISRMLADPTRSVEEACASYHRIRKPRVEEIYLISAKNAEVRKKSGSWGIWAKEWMIWAAFSNPWGWGLRGQVLGQKFTIYDIDEEEI